MNYFKSWLGLLLLCMTIYTVKAQESTPYYRYFTVGIESLTPSEFTEFSSLRSVSEPMVIDAFCSTSTTVLVKFDAGTTALRIEEMEKEIETLFSNQFSSARIQSISHISYADQLNFCK